MPSRPSARLNPHRSGSSSSARLSEPFRLEPGARTRRVASQSPSFGVFVFGAASDKDTTEALLSLNPHRSGSSSSARLRVRRHRLQSPQSQSPSFGVFVFGRRQELDDERIRVVSIPIVRGLRLRPVDDRRFRRPPRSRLNPHRSGSSSSAVPSLRVPTSWDSVSIPIVRGLRLRPGVPPAWPRLRGVLVSIPIVRGLRLRLDAVETAFCATFRSQSPSFGVFVFGQLAGADRPGADGAVSIPIVRGLRLRPPSWRPCTGASRSVSIPIVRGLRLRHERRAFCLLSSAMVSIPIVRGLRLRRLQSGMGAVPMHECLHPIVRGLRLRRTSRMEASHTMFRRLNPHRSGSSSSAGHPPPPPPPPRLRSQSPSFGVFVFGLSTSKTSTRWLTVCLNPHRSGSSSSATASRKRTRADHVVSIPIVRGLRLRPRSMASRPSAPSASLNPHRSGSSSSAAMLAWLDASSAVQVSIPIVRGLRLRQIKSITDEQRARFPVSIPIVRGLRLRRRRSTSPEMRTGRCLNPHRSGSSSSARKRP